MIDEAKACGFIPGINGLAIVDFHNGDLLPGLGTFPAFVLSNTFSGKFADFLPGP
jgi:hypothetical protein